jgi:hypothetical protein
MVGDRGDNLERARTDALDPDPGHRFRNGFLVHRHALVVEIGGDPWSPVAALGCLVVRKDPRLEPCPRRLRRRRLDAVSCLLPLVVPGHRYFQQPCHPDHLEVGATSAAINANRSALVDSLRSTL